MTSKTTTAGVEFTEGSTAEAPVGVAVVWFGEHCDVL